MKEFDKLLNNSTLSEVDKKSLKFLIKDFKGNPLLTSRSYIFTGDVGVGKTFLARKLIEVIGEEMIYLGSAELKNAKRCSSFQEVIKQMKKGKTQVVFLDDLNNLFEKDSCLNITYEHRKAFMQILDATREDHSKLLITTINYMAELEEGMIDRIEVKIEVDLPSERHKKNFLGNSFGDFLSRKMINYLATNSIGYNLRDLPELVRLSYRLGMRNVSKKSVMDALHNYKPTQLHGLDVQNGITTRLRDIIGKRELIKLIRRLVQVQKKRDLSNRLGLRRHNLLLFHGPPGTGKTFMAKALAGEMDYPVISAKAKNIYRSDGLFSIVNLAKRYSDCIIFIDEAEKIFGNDRFEKENDLMGEFNRELENIDGRDINCILIMAVNDLSRIGDALRDRFVQLEFGLPCYDERYSFCRIKSHHSKINLDFGYMAKLTEGMSFRDIDRIWNELMFHRMEKGDVITPDTICSTVKELRGDDVGGMIG